MQKSGVGWGEIFLVKYETVMINNVHISMSFLRPKTILLKVNYLRATPYSIPSAKVLIFQGSPIKTTVHVNERNF